LQAPSRYWRAPPSDWAPRTSPADFFSLPGSAAWAPTAARGLHARRREHHVEVDPERAAKRLESGAVHEVTDSLPRALESVARAMSERRAWAVALVANAADVYPAIAAGSLRPDVVTDQTAAHDLLYGYVPQGYSPADVRRERERNPAKLTADGVRSIGVHVRRCSNSKSSAPSCSTTAT